MFVNGLDRYQLSVCKHLLIAYDFCSFSSNLQLSLSPLPIDRT